VDKMSDELLSLLFAQLDRNLNPTYHEPLILTGTAVCSRGQGV
jgi:hypothetical protein